MVTEDDKIINNLKNEKDKYIKKLKDFKDLEESYQLQINSLKTQIKEMIRQQKEDSDDNINKKDSKKELKKKYNDLVVANLNLKNQLEYELNSNKQLKTEVKNKDEQIDGLNLFIGKLMSEKEKNIMENMKDTNKGRVNTDSGHKGTKTEEGIKVTNLLEIAGEEKEVKFEQVESYYYLFDKYIVCPKGSYHPYDFTNKEEIKPDENFIGENWDLRCYKHSSGFFLVFYCNLCIFMLHLYKLIN